MREKGRRRQTMIKKISFHIKGQKPDHKIGLVTKRAKTKVIEYIFKSKSNKFNNFGNY